MASAYGDGSPSGGTHGECLQAIRQYFQQRTCRSCLQPYTEEGIEFLRQEPGVIVVRVGCVLCGHPLGIALVGMNTQPTNGACVHGRPGAHRRQPAQPPEWTRRDVQRLAHQPPITYDDVLRAHQFFSQLEADWSKFLPRQKRGRLVQE